MRFTKRLIAIWMAALLLLAATSCSKTKGPAATTEPPERPEVTPAPNKIAPPEVERFAGYSLSLKPVHGPSVVLREPIGAQLVMDAYLSDRLRVDDAKAEFGNKLDVLDAEGKPRYRFTLASDGQMLMKADDGRVFRMPEYIYYLLEEQMWTFPGSLVQEDLKWDPAAGTAQMELQLPRLLKTAMLPAFGYATAYFVTYTIYGVNTETRDTAKIYLLMTYAGYDVRGTAFAPNFLYTSPATAIFKKSGGSWRLTAFRQPSVSEDKENKNQLYDNVRTIFPYDYMETVLEDLKDTSPQVKDILRQATEYLNNSGLTGLTVES